MQKRFFFTILMAVFALSTEGLTYLREEIEAEESTHWGVQLINNTWDFAKQKWQQLMTGKHK